MLISCMVTAQLICTFVFAYAKSKSSHDAAQIVQIIKSNEEITCPCDMFCGGSGRAGGGRGV